MKRRAARLRAHAAARRRPPQDLIHTNKVPNPIAMRVSGRSGAFQRGCYQALDFVRPAVHFAFRLEGLKRRYLLAACSAVITGWGYISAVTWRPDAGTT